jgi:hydroxyethylthiazole kinase-like uncharacterized protein yjeF
VSDELLTNTEMATADRLTIEAGTPGIALMEAAGRAVADAARREFPDARRILVAAGPGNNGGDGYVAARLLAEAGFDVTLAGMLPAAMMKGDAALAGASYGGPYLDLAGQDPAGFDLVIDALYGAGLRGGIDGEAGEFIERLGAAGVPVLAVDLPSGVVGSTGEVKGPAVRSEATVTFFRAKPAHYLYPGRALRGRLTVADIGIPARVLETIRPETWLNGPALWGDAFPRPDPTGHKYGRGHAVVLSGPLHRTGAARLAARAALRIGSGLVTVASPKSALLVNAAHLTAIMLAPVDTAAELAELLSDRRFTAVAIGPAAGVGGATAAKVRAALASAAHVVIDADGMTSFAESPTDLFDVIAAREADTVLTPHDGEFARLFPDLGAGSRLDRARAAAARAGAVVVLKGPDTVIAAPDRRAAINANAEPWLATAGSGDVLAGLVAGLLAQGMPAFEAAAAAVWLHGEAGRGPGLIAEDIAEALPAVLARLLGEAGGA